MARQGPRRGVVDEPVRLHVTLVPKLIDEALRRRAGFAVAAGTTLRRLIDGEGDGLPGVVADRYGHVVRVELWATSWPEGLEPLADRLCREAGVSAVVVVLRTAAGTSQQRVLRGVVPEAHVVTEAGMRLLVRVADERAVGSGVFVDQREGRRLVREAARGRPVVNLFAHAGAFGVAAAVGGASRVDHVDMAKKTAPWAATNLALNGFDPRGHRFIVDDALQVLAKLARKQGGYGVVVCDPPTQAVRKDGSRFLLRTSLAELAEHGCAALDDGGLLILSCNDRDVPVEQVLAAASDGARAAGRAVRSVVELPLPQDCTSVSAPKGRPMRGAVLRLK